MSEFLVRSAGWSAIVDADSPGHAVDKAVHAPDAPDVSQEGIGVVIQVIDLDAADAVYVDTALTLAKLGYEDIKTAGGLVVSGAALKERA